MTHLILVVSRLSHVTFDPDDPLPDYPSLVRPRDVAVLGLMVLGYARALQRAPVVQLSLWSGYLGVGGMLVWMDLKTVWLPGRLYRIATARVTAGLAVVAVHSLGAFVMVLVGTCATSDAFWLVRRSSGSFGSGDIRLRLLMGAAIGSVGLQARTAALLAGTLIGASWAIVHALHGRAPEPSPYGPSLQSGPVMAAVLADGS